MQDSFGPAMYYLHHVRDLAQTGFFDVEVQIADNWYRDRLVIAASDETDAVAAVWQLSGQDGGIRETLLLASDPDTQLAFEQLFQ